MPAALRWAIIGHPNQECCRAIGVKPRVPESAAGSPRHADAQRKQHVVLRFCGRPSEAIVFKSVVHRNRPGQNSRAGRKAPRSAEAKLAFDCGLRVCFAEGRRHRQANHLTAGKDFGQTGLRAIPGVCAAGGKDREARNRMSTAACGELAATAGSRHAQGSEEGGIRQALVKRRHGNAQRMRHSLRCGH